MSSLSKTNSRVLLPNFSMSCNGSTPLNQTGAKSVHACCLVCSRKGVERSVNKGMHAMRLL